jgi:hypothetical protein
MHVVGSVIDAQNPMFVHSIADKGDFVTFGVCECMLITIIWNIGMTGKQVVL